MSVQFKMIPKQNNLVSPPEVKYYPCAVSKGEMQLEDLAKIISGRSSMSKADCYGVIMALSDVIGEALSNGNIVKIDSLGTFQLILQGVAAETEQVLGKSNIKGAKISYKPSKELKSKIKRITYKRMR
ncbi:MULTISPECIES: HU family DNA-binding protein [Flavobacterium]|jgi:predicted histone-like DNA-binding protein|uniref:HU domain-containing protein n=2 Tax=Flavobacterium TaxID=237 RepID=A0ABP7UUD2_9FLAO